MQVGVDDVFLDWNPAEQLHGELAVDQNGLLPVGKEVKTLVNMIILCVRADPIVLIQGYFWALDSVQVLELLRPQILVIETTALGIDPTEVLVAVVGCLTN